MVKADSLAPFFQKYPEISFKKGETILRAEEPLSEIFYITKGTVRLFKVTLDGREVTLALSTSTAYFPLVSTMCDLPNHFNYQAMTPVLIRHSPAKDFRQFVDSDPTILLEIIQRTLRGLDQSLTNMEALLSGDSYHRVVSALLFVANRFGTSNAKGEITFAIPLTHQDIAFFCSITRETTSQVIGKLEKLGVITYRHHRQIIISNLPLLKEQLDS